MRYGFRVNVTAISIFEPLKASIYRRVGDAWAVHFEIILTDRVHA